MVQKGWQSRCVKIEKMDPNNPFCVFCNKKGSNLCPFTEESLARCRAIVQIRREKNLEHKNVQLPQCVNQVQCYHSAPCYQKFTALTAKYRPLLKQLLAAPCASLSADATETSSNGATNNDVHVHPPAADPSETYESGSITETEDEIDLHEFTSREDLTAGNLSENYDTENAPNTAGMSTSTPEPSYSDCLSAMVRYGSFGVSPLSTQPPEAGEAVGNVSSRSILSLLESNQPNQMSTEPSVAHVENSTNTSGADEVMQTLKECENWEFCIFCKAPRRKVNQAELFLSFIESADARNNLIADATELNDKAFLETITEYIEKNRRMYYHALCRTEYANECHNKTCEKIGDTGWHKTRAINQRAFLYICNYVEDHVVNANEVIFLQTLKDEYVQIIKSEHYKNVKSPTKFSGRHLEEKLIRKFGKKIKIGLLNNKKIVQPAKAIVINPEDMDEFYKRNSRHAVALALRRDILAIQKEPLPGDLKVADLIRGECTIPPDLLDFFKVLLNAPIDSGKSWSKAIACVAIQIDIESLPDFENWPEPCSSAENTPLTKRRRMYDHVTPELPIIRGKPKVVQTLLGLDHPFRAVNMVNVQRARQIDFTLILSHFRKIPNTPMFFGYNSLIHIDPSPKQKVFYLTTMNHSPTDASVVLETMIRTAKAADECNAPYIESTYDLGIAKVAFQLQSSQQLYNPDLKKSFHHIGTFHIKLNYNVAVGKFIKECGLATVIIDAELIGTDSAHSFIFGKNYSRCKRLHHFSYVALEILHFESFLEASGMDLSDEVDQLLKDFMRDKQVVPTLREDELLHIFDKYENYKRQTLLGEHGKTAQFYAMYCSMVSNILMLERAIRTSDFELLMYVLPKFTDVFFAFNHQNYARYLSLYHDNLMNIDHTHPGLKATMIRSLGVRRNDKDFGKQDYDYVLETTINNESANKMTGTRHIMNNLGALQRWTDSHTLRTDIIAYTTKKLQLQSKEDVTFELRPCTLKKHKHQLDSLIRAFKLSINPFSADLDDDKLYNISTGKAVSDEISGSLLGILEKGEALKKKFISECSADPTRFEKVITRNEYKTFEDALPKKKSKAAGKAKSLKEQCDMFGRLLGISIEQNLNMEKVLKFPLTKFPACFSHPDGTMTKTDKAALSKAILGKASWEPPSSLDYNLIDGYFFLHLLKDVPVKFGNIAQKILKSALNMNGNNIFLVFDRYFSPSIKDSEHSLRGTERLADRKIDGSLQVRAFEWSKEMRNVNFKEELVKFLVNEWVNDEYAEILGTRKIYISCENCYEFSVVGGKMQRTIHLHLSCPYHEEADTKLVFHACQVPPSSSVAIRCSDTDVLIIMLGNMQHLKDGVRVWMDFGTGNARKTIDVTELRAALGDICDALPGIHAFTGNDFNPCFYGMGKTKPFNTLKDISKNDLIYMQAFTALGDDDIPNGLERIIENFTCHLYSVNNRVLPRVNAVRFAMFQRAYKCERTGESFLKIKYKFDPARLPPCKRELLQQIRRSAYICNLWRHAHRARPTMRDPLDFGWIEKDGKYAIKWFEGDQTPKEVRDVIGDEEIDENDEESDAEMTEMAPSAEHEERGSLHNIDNQRSSEMASNEEDGDGGSSHDFDNRASSEIAFNEDEDLLYDIEYRISRANGEQSEEDSESDIDDRDYD
ncbi:hypothetical protein QAD02_001569 [Eretmocerus hayati]|uniref:Uncharacterized protein n=1 Tax=Eretmocerus hayati TaxID=131215 RepID=A0ACC2NGL8_9HYME|nr:hypothetical protein QAD02_001569 [Eretmocerus hayati]